MAGVVARVQLQIRLPADMHERIAALAQQEMRSLNGQLLFLLQRGLDGYEPSTRVNGQSPNGQAKPTDGQVVSAAGAD